MNKQLDPIQSVLNLVRQHQSACPLHSL